MRDVTEILFRGKRVDNMKWAYGYYANCAHPSGPEGQTGHYIITYPGHPEDYHEIYTSTVGKYTGLTDKDGVRIFEGDIVKTGILDGEDWFEVRYGICGGTKNVLHEVGYIGFYLQPASKAAKEYQSFGLRNDIVYWIKQGEGVEVIGNIHDNPELLEGGDER